MVHPEAVGKALEILLVEDNPTAVLLTQEVCTHTTARHRFHVVPDGVKALAFLPQQGPYVKAPQPDHIHLDLKLPKKDGHEVLPEVKADIHRLTSPVMGLTTSQDPQDIRAAYILHANSYIAKPENFLQLIEVVQALEHFWYTIARLPSP